MFVYSSVHFNPRAYSGSPVELGICAIVLRTIAAVLAKCLKPRRRPLGDCRNCGYNLTGNVSGICPECGTVSHLK